jgi:hypothetical protein
VAQDRVGDGVEPSGSAPIVSVICNEPCESKYTLESRFGGADIF